MKFPQAIQSLLSKKQDRRNVYASLYIDVHCIAVSFWSIDEEKLPHVLAWEGKDNLEDSWETKAEEIDRMIGILEEKTGETEIVRIILGLPSIYLTPGEEIKKEIQKNIKDLTRILELTPIGFVPVHQAIIYSLKRDEGVPPSVILLSAADRTITLMLYKIGTVAGTCTVEYDEKIAQNIEQGIKGFVDLEVLPARMLLYGSTCTKLEKTQADLLRHPWTAKVNFLHFPKIEIITLDKIISAVSLAGASELEESPEVTMQQSSEKDIILKKEKPGESEVDVTSDKAPIEESDEEIHTAVAVGDDVAAEKTIPKDITIEDALYQAQETIAEDLTAKSKQTDANVVMVNAESLGFKKNVDVLEEDVQHDEVLKEETTKKVKVPALNVQRKAVQIGSMVPKVTEIIKNVKGFRFFLQPKWYISLLTFAAIVIAAWAFYWFIPHATIVLYTIPKQIEQTKNITIDPTATVTDAQHIIIPGRKKEQTVSGEKTVPVTGKKKIGDPAKGTVAIYNKSANSSLILPKGTTISTGSLKFTLDSDITVASASSSESITGTGMNNVITYATAVASVTAAEVGAQSNIPSGTQFSIGTIDASRAIARNDAAFSGGNSREASVVSRDDYDTIVKVMSEELVTKAKKDLAETQQGGERLIDNTIKTAVTSKAFSKEINEEASQLNGKLSVSVAGIAYSDADVSALLTSFASELVPAGYELDSGKRTVNVTGIQIRKDGTISAKASMQVYALPVIDSSVVRKNIAGKSLNEASQYIRGLTGIASMTVNKNLRQMPINVNNISVRIAVAQ
jgi:hypothetical protein